MGVLIVGFAEGLGAAKTYAAKAGYQIVAEPGTDRPRRRQSRLRAVLRDGGQRQPVEDRGERRRRRPLADAAAWWSPR